MNTISVLIVVDVVGALAAGSLMNNVYMVDTNKYLGSWQEGADSLHTICQDSQQVNWMVKSISPSDDVSIVRFTGDMVSRGICNPVLQGAGDNSSWAAQVQSHGVYSSFSYTVTLTMDDKKMSFSPYLKIV